MIAFMDRVFFVDQFAGLHRFMFKPGAAVVSARRAGTTAALCPNCGANTVMRLKTTGRCAYCGSYISMDEQGNATIAKV